MVEIPFVRGGPVKFDSSVYIVREKEESVLRAIQHKEFVSIVGPRQVGKTSLLQKIQAIVESNYDYASALIDLSAINDPNLEFKEWAYHFCKLLNRQLLPFVSNEIEIDFPKASVEFREYWTSIVSLLNRSSLLILLDEANSVPSKVNDPFFSTIRSIFTDRNLYRPDPQLARINFAFAGVFEPDDLVKNRQNSPFNVSQIFRLSDFSKDEVGLFAIRLSEEIGEKIHKEILDRIYYWTDGQPYLSQSLYAILQTQILEHGITSINPEQVDKLIPELIDQTSDNVNHTIKLILSSNEKEKKVIEILGGKRFGFTRANRLLAQLELDGIIKEGNDHIYVIRNAIYELALKKALNMSDEVSPTISAKSSRETLFISYSHLDDPKYLDKLKTHLAPLARNHKIVVWDDSKILPGEKWREEIQEGINNAKVAILMVSPNFIASEFIANSELPPILDAAELGKNGITIFWIPVSSCAYEDTAIAKYQAAINPQKPLDMMSEAELNQALVTVYRGIRCILIQ